MEDFATQEIAVKLKEKGFSEKCLYHYFDNKFVANTCKSDNDNITTEDLLMSCNYLVSQFDTLDSNVAVSDAPTISQVLKWLRETKNIEVVASFSYGNKVWGYQVGDMTLLEDSILSYDYSFPTYEEAVLAGIEYVLDNLI